MQACSAPEILFRQEPAKSSKNRSRSLGVVAFAKMSASSDLRRAPPLSRTLPAQAAVDSVVANFFNQQRMFKKHKVLPHPMKEGSVGGMDGAAYKGIAPRLRTVLDSYVFEADSVSSRASWSQSCTDLERQLTGTLIEPPPTPPAHSHSMNSWDYGSPLPIRGNRHYQNPATLSNHCSPPTPNLTPDRTPPGPAKRRPKIGDDVPFKTTSDSRTESFKTAQETPCPSEEDDERSTLRPVPSLANSSLSTMHHVNNVGSAKTRSVGLGPELGMNQGGEWGSISEVEQECDDNLGRNVTVKRRRPRPHANNLKNEPVQRAVVTPPKAAKMPISTPLDEGPACCSSRQVLPDRFGTTTDRSQTRCSVPESSSDVDLHRASVFSTKSGASAIVEAILIEPVPQRRRTLRHVPKASLLRDLVSDQCPNKTEPTLLGPEDGRRPQLSSRRVTSISEESHASTCTIRSISSCKARQNIWKSGAIPVVVLPQRGSSASVQSNSQERLLRSTRGSHNSRSQSVGSTALYRNFNSAPQVEQPSHSRPLSKSDQEDLQAIDYPSVISKRSSGLSAPTNRNASRTTLLATGNPQAHITFQAQKVQQQAAQNLKNVNEVSRKLRSSDQTTHGRQRSIQKIRDEPKCVQPPPQSQNFAPEITSHRALSMSSISRQERHNVHEPLLNDGWEGEPFFGKRLSDENTPFSQASIDTAGTSHAEVSKATAINIYPHQNASVMVVNHCSRPSESLLTDQDGDWVASKVASLRKVPKNNPQKPPQPISSLDVVASSFSNPRAPPAPPEINFIPATPLGLTPTAEKDKQLGALYETKAQRPSKSMVLLRVAFGRRHRNSEYNPSSSHTSGLFTHTFPLSRNLRKETADNISGHSRSLSMTKEDRLIDENRLHPHWRPAHGTFDDSDDDEFEEDAQIRGDHVCRYSLMDKRPALLRRSWSARMKRTFAILPLQDNYDDGHYQPGYIRGADKRKTIRRMPSGNLCVVKRRRSADSFGRRAHHPPRGSQFTVSTRSTTTSGRRFTRQ